MIRRISLSLFVTLIAIGAAADAATTVRGRVLAADGTPYPSAAVTLESASGAKKPPVYTDREGMFYVSNVAPGAYTMHVKTSRSEKTFPVTARPAQYSDVAPVSVK